MFTVAAGWAVLFVAHSGQPADAPLLQPSCLAPSEPYVDFVWADQDTPTPVGSATVSLYRTQQQPAPFVLGTRPASLQGELIYSVLEEDPRNTYRWELADVAAGHWYIYSEIEEPAGQPGQPSDIYVRFAPTVVSVKSAALEPTVFITRPGNEFAVTAGGSYRIEYCVHNASPQARVYIKAQPREGGTLSTIATDLPATPTGSFEWKVDVAPGDWSLRATVVDCDQQTFTSWARYFVFVSGGSDAGVADLIPPDLAGALCTQVPDGGAADAFEAGDAQPSDGSGPASGGEGCACASATVTRTSQSPAAFLFLLSILLLRMRRTMLRG